MGFEELGSGVLWSVTYGRRVEGIKYSIFKFSVIILVLVVDLV